MMCLYIYWLENIIKVFLNFESEVICLIQGSFGNDFSIFTREIRFMYTLLSPNCICRITLSILLNWKCQIKILDHIKCLTISDISYNSPTTINNNIPNRILQVGFRRVKYTYIQTLPLFHRDTEIFFERPSSQK